MLAKMKTKYTSRMSILHSLPYRWQCNDCEAWNAAAYLDDAKKDAAEHVTDERHSVLVSRLLGWVDPC